jgi:hypothetical protein
LSNHSPLPHNGELLFGVSLGDEEMLDSDMVMRDAEPRDAAE